MGWGADALAKPAHSPARPAFDSYKKDSGYERADRPEYAGRPAPGGAGKSFAGHDKKRVTRTARPVRD
jgi:hypothetical protein